ncbi:hypothetical protein ACFZDF_26325 [Streptomyces sp. NPDC007910]|uniref:hypothetical protein n=1 Tax=Streptomyces sp. NPDC007910 TaxID=3364790 RepID=UPI0036EE5BC9
MNDPAVQATRTLLIDALSSAPDADTSTPDLRTMFTPSSHRLALDPDVTVVRGARGTGKTYWAKALTDPELREVASASYMMPRLGRIEVVTGFAQGGVDDPVFPGKRALASLVAQGVDAKDLWSAVVLMALKVPEVHALETWSERIEWVARNGEKYEAALRRADRETRERGKTLVLLFDTLDHLHNDRGQLDRLLSGLFEVALELRLTTGSLRAKIFVRPDLYESAPKAFADASKLGANATDLSWSRENLYGLLFHQLGNHTSNQAAAFRKATGAWQPEGEGRYIAPVAVIADQKRQEEVFVTLAGPYMGTDRRKGHTYTWVPNHLQDGLGRVSPRTWLHALLRSAQLTDERYAGHSLPLHYDAIRESLSSASKNRVEELMDDIGWAALAVELLEGNQVPMEPSAVRFAWESNRLSARITELLEDVKQGSGPRNVESPAEILQELLGLGVMTERTNKAIDLPDIYRLNFDIRRKGGVARKPVI